MSKLITLIDSNTSEYVYPTTSTNLIIDDNGSSILEFVENSIYEVKFYINNEAANIKQLGNSIKKLKGRTNTEEELDISKNVTQIEINKNSIAEINHLSNHVQDNIQTIKISDDTYDEIGVVNVLNYLSNTIDLIEYGTPTTSPSRKRIMVDEKNLYIGLNKTWYVIKLDR